MNIGIIGVGNISGIYFQNLSRSSSVHTLACADIDLERARLASARYRVPIACTVSEMLENSDIDVILNLTTPQSHVPIALEAIRNGKHVYTEKPLGLDFYSAQHLIQSAEKAGLHVGCAPDTFLGGSHQKCRELIDEGELGELVGVQGFMFSGGHESWHPNPAFFYQQGGGPMLDMGPYYLTAMVNLLGPIEEVKSFARTTHKIRTITSEPLSGQTIEVETPTHIASLLRFQSGVVGELTTSFDVPVHKMPSIVVYGSKATLIVSDPNGFGGTPEIRKRGEQEWVRVEVDQPYQDNSRGIGLIQFVKSIGKSAPLVSGELALHVLEAMIASIEGRPETYFMNTTVDRPARLPSVDYFDQVASDWDN